MNGTTPGSYFPDDILYLSKISPPIQ